MFRPDRAGAARPAAPAHAIRAGRALHMGDAGADVVAGGRERPDRASFQAPASEARIAGGRSGLWLGDGERVGKAQRAAIGVPQPVAGMDQNSDRRDMDGLGAPRPLLERQPRRPAKGKQRCRAELRARCSRSPADSNGRADRQGHRSPRARRRRRSTRRVRSCRRERSCERQRAGLAARSRRARNAPRGTRPTRRMASNALSTSAPFTRIAQRGGKQASFVPLAWRASLVYMRTILRQGFGGRKIQMRR